MLEPALGLSRVEAELRPGFDDRFGKEALLQAPGGPELDLHRTFAQGASGADHRRRRPLRSRPALHSRRAPTPGAPAQPAAHPRRLRRGHGRLAPPTRRRPRCGPDPPHLGSPDGRGAAVRPSMAGGSRSRRGHHHGVGPAGAGSHAAPRRLGRLLPAVTGRPPSARLPDRAEPGHDPSPGGPAGHPRPVRPRRLPAGRGLAPCRLPAEPRARPPRSPAAGRRAPPSAGDGPPRSPSQPPGTGTIASTGMSTDAGHSPPLP